MLAQTVMKLLTTRLTGVKVKINLLAFKTDSLSSLIIFNRMETLVIETANLIV